MTKKSSALLIAAIAAAGVLAWYFLHFRPAKDAGSDADPSAAASGPRPQASAAAQAPSASTSTTPVASPSPRAPRTAAGDPLQALLDYLKKHDPAASWSIDRYPDGRVRNVMGGLIAGGGGTDEASLRTARALSTLMGTEDVQLANALKHRTEGPGLLSITYQQEYKDFEVYQGYLSVMSRTLDGAVYLVNSDLKSVESPSLEITLSQAEALRLVAQKYSVQLTQVRAIGTKPVVWTGAPLQQLAWVFAVRILTPRIDSREAVFGIVSRAVVWDRSGLVN